MNKRLIKRHAKDFINILDNIDVDGTFTSVSSNVEGHKLKTMSTKKLIILVGYDAKRRLNIYRIPYQQIKLIQDTIRDNYASGAKNTTG